jgi:hypothetical protein
MWDTVIDGDWAGHDKWSGDGSRSRGWCSGGGSSSGGSGCWRRHGDGHVRERVLGDRGGGGGLLRGDRHGQLAGSVVLVVAAVELGLNVLQNGGIAGFAEGRLEGKDYLTEVVVLTLERLDNTFELLRLTLEADASVVMGVLEFLNHVLELLKVTLFAVAEGALSGPILFLADGRRGRVGLAAGLLTGLGRWLRRRVTGAVVVAQDRLAVLVVFKVVLILGAMLFLAYMNDHLYEREEK